MSDHANATRRPAGAVDARSAVAPALDSTRRLSDAFASIAAAALPILPFERMGVALLEGDETIRLFVMPAEGGREFEEHIVSRPQFSERLWPVRGKAVCVRRSANELDTTFEIDRRIVEAGRESVLAVSLAAQGRQIGALWFDARTPSAFTDGHAAALEPLADLLALAVEHDRLWILEQDRRRRRASSKPSFRRSPTRSTFASCFRECRRSFRTSFPTCRSPLRCSRRIALESGFTWLRTTTSATCRSIRSRTRGKRFDRTVVGHLFDRRGPGWICGPCMAVAACAFASLAVLTPRLWHLYAVFALVGLAMTGTSYVVYSRVVSGWFDARRGLALASMVASSGVGGIVFPPAAQALITLTGWRTACLILGGLAAGMGLPVILKFVRERTFAGRETGRPDTRGIISNALRSRILWTLLVVVFGTTMAINGVIVHLSALLTDRGMSPDSAAFVLSAMGVASLTGRLATGWLLDRFVARRVSFVLLATAALGTFTLGGAQSTSAGMIAAALIGFGTGGGVDLFPYMLSRYFGLAALSTLMGVAWMAFGVAGATGPILVGRAYDATGSYEFVLMFAAAGALAMGALMLSLPACERRSPSAARHLNLS